MNYDSFKKQALLESADTNWLMRKDTLTPGAYKHLRAQDYGKTTSFLAALVLGAGLGYLSDKVGNSGKDSFGSTLGGALIGGTAATAMNLLGTGAAAITPTRTKEEHEAYENSGTAPEWLIPGVANYNHAKTYGYALHGAEAKKQQKRAAAFDFGSPKLWQMQDAYDSAPIVGGVGGTALGIPAGLLAGAGTYGALSLIPGLKKRRGVKLLAALLAGGGAGVAAGIPAGRALRDLYWKDQTGLPSPWRTYSAEQGGIKASVKPSDLAFDFSVSGQNGPRASLNGSNGSFTIPAQGEDKLKFIREILNDVAKHPVKYKVS